MLQSFTCGIFPVQHSQNHSSYWSKARGNGSSSQDRTPVGRAKFSLPYLTRRFWGMGLCLQIVKVTIVTFMIVQKHVTIQCGRRINLKQSNTSPVILLDILKHFLFSQWLTQNPTKFSPYHRSKACQSCRRHRLRRLRPKLAFPQPITIQNMRLIGNVPFWVLFHWHVW